MWWPFACRPALFITFFLVNARGCHFLGSKHVDCHFISFGMSIRMIATLSACGLVWALLLRTAFCLRRFRPVAIPSYPLARNVLAPFWSRTALLVFKIYIYIYTPSSVRPRSPSVSPLHLPAGRRRVTLANCKHSPFGGGGGMVWQYAKIHTLLL